MEAKQAARAYSLSKEKILSRAKTKEIKLFLMVYFFSDERKSVLNVLAVH